VPGFGQELIAMIRFIPMLICTALLCTSEIAHCDEFTAKVIAVLDGDTVLIKRTSGLVKIRLAEIDAPEKTQTFGETSKESLSRMVLGKQARVASQVIDQYGRLVAYLSVDGLDVNAEQIRRGMAWEYSNYHGNQALIALQNEAKQTQRGLWAQNNPTPPWEWRKQHPSTYSSQSNAAVSSVTISTNAASLDPSCGNKKHCSEMFSCEEAKHYFVQCGVKTLDGDGDGVPCEKLCASIQKN
jgi:endonuclease YncB( thermonuclease family)